METSLRTTAFERTIPEGLRRLPYALFALLFIFETLNFFHLLPLSAEFGWRGRFISTAGVFLSLYGLQLLFRKKLQMELPAVAWMLGSVLLLVDFLGDVYFLYSRWPLYDEVAHFLGGPILVTVFLIILNRLSKGLGWRHPFFLLSLLALGISSMCAVLYETEEYLEDVIFSAHRLGDGPDTVNDLAMNLVGGTATVLAVHAYRRLRRTKSIAPLPRSSELPSLVR